MLDAQQFALGIDVGDSEGHGFADAQSGAVAGHQGRAVFQAGDVVEKGQHFLLAEHDGEFMRAADAGEVFVGPGQFESGEVEELDGGNELVDAFRGELAFVEQVELILADGFDVRDFGA